MEENKKHIYGENSLICVYKINIKYGKEYVKIKI